MAGRPATHPDQTDFSVHHHQGVNMSRYPKTQAMLVAAGILTVGLPQFAQTPDFDALKLQVQKLGDEVKQLKDQQKTDQTSKAAVTSAGGLSTNVLGGTITLYGDIDMYFNHMSSSSGAKINAFEDGAILRSRWGLKGEKPMGDGYAMKFTLEGGFNTLNGQGADLPSYNSTLNSTYGGRLFDRQAWVGFATPAGEFRFGRQDTTIFFKGAEIDFGERTLGGIINLFGVPSRFDADVCYISPRLYGLQTQWHYAFGGSNVANGNTNQNVWQASLDYVKGPLSVGYQQIVANPPAGAKYDTSVVYRNPYINYRFGKARVFLSYVHSNNQTTSGALANGGSLMSNVGINGPANGSLFTGLLAGTDPNVGVYYDVWQGSAEYWLTKKLKAGALWGTIKDTSGGGKNAKGGAVGLWYDMFRDTLIYAYYDVISNDPKAGFRQAASAGLPTNFSAAADVNGQKISGVQLGVRYKF
jgi:predicted porin